MTSLFSRQTALASALVVAGLAGAAPGAAHAEPMSREQGAAILQELKAIRQLLEQQQSKPTPQAAATPAPTPAAAPVRVDLSQEGHTLGATSAPLTLVMFTDHECPFCKRFLQESLTRLRQDYIDTGKLRLILRDMPLDMHPNAQRAAEVARCASEQGKHWPLLEAFGSVSEPLSPPVMTRLVQGVGLDTGRIDACVAEGRYTAKVKASSAEARRLGFNGTPTFVLGATTTGSGAFEGDKMVGIQPYESLKRRLDDQLAKTRPKP